MTPDEIRRWNGDLRGQEPLEIIRWALQQANGRALVSTNFRPYEAVLLHLCVQVQPDIPILWVDHGYNRPATYRHAEDLRVRLRLDLKTYIPRISAAHRDAIHGPLPLSADEAGLRRFSALMKLEPFRRGMKELAPRAWITGLRQTQSASRAGLDIISPDPNFGTLKVSPLCYFTDAEMEDYREHHNLPIEWDYYDPAKADEQRECGLHATWGAGAPGADQPEINPVAGVSVAPIR